MAPGDGFAAAARLADRRVRAGVPRAEGWSPYVLGALGGAAAMTVWLKVGGLAGLRSVSAADFRWGNLVAALVLGALVGLAGQVLWGRVGPRLVDLLHGGAPGRDCRIVWGASALPQVIGLVALVPLDLAVVGPEIFATDNLGDSLITAWAAFSIAVTLSLALWSLYLFVRGTEVTASLPVGRAVAASIGAGLCFGAPAALFFVALVEIAGRTT